MWTCRTIRAAQPPLDCRLSFASERTYLAYLRTSLALLATGIAVVGALPYAGHEGIRRWMGVALVIAGWERIGGGARGVVPVGDLLSTFGLWGRLVVRAGC
jgi:uncharacterized membrane protein YidH (DUF202 family)